MADLAFRDIPGAVSISPTSTTARSRRLPVRRTLRRPRRGLARRLGRLPLRRAGGKSLSRRGGRRERSSGLRAVRGTAPCRRARPTPPTSRRSPELLAVDDHVPTAAIRLRRIRGRRPERPTCPRPSPRTSAATAFSPASLRRAKPDHARRPPTHDRRRRVEPEGPRTRRTGSAASNTPTRTPSWCWAAMARCSRPSASTGGCGCPSSG